MARVDVKTLARNPIDRLINYFSPEAANRRLVARAKREAFFGMYGQGGWEVAKTTNRTTGKVLDNARDVSADSENVPDLPNLRRLSSAALRSSGVARSGLDQIVTKGIGTGLVWQSKPDASYLGISEDEAQEYGRAMEFIWAFCSKRLDINRQLNFDMLSRIDLYSTLEMGDAWSKKVAVAYPGDKIALKCQQIEAGRICNPNFKPDTDRLMSGVERDDHGVPIAIHVANRHPGDYYAGAQRGGNALTWVRVPIFGNQTGRRIVTQSFYPTRIGQTRGVPILSTVLANLENLTTYGQAELMAAVINSCFALGVKSDDANPLGQGDQVSSGGIKRFGFSPEPGMILEGMGVEEQVMSFTPGRPSATFAPFWDAITDELGAAIGVPGSVLRRRFTASYSASRAELLECYAAVQLYRQGTASGFNQEYADEVIYQAVVNGLIELPGWEDPMIWEAWLRGNWIGPAVASLDPLKEANAAEIRIKNNCSTEEIEASQTFGNDWSTIRPQRSREIALNKADGIAVDGKSAGEKTTPEQNQDRPENEKDLPE